MIKMSKVYKVLNHLKKQNLKLEEAINKTIYQYEDDFIVFYDYDGDEEYKGIIIFSDDKEKIGTVDWYYIDKSMKEYLVLKE
jgi:hypothetical protein